MSFQSTLGELTEPERRLVDAARAGARARLRDQVVRGALIRELLFHGDAVASGGIALDGARIAGAIDLEGCASEVPLLLFGCHLGEADLDESPLVLRDARLPRFGLYDCTVYGGIKAERLQIESTLFMTRSRVHGQVRLRGARIGGSLNLEESTLRDPSTALGLDSAEVRGNWLMREATVSGTVRFIGAQLDGSLLMEAATFEAAEHALLADTAAIRGAWVLNRATVRGRLRLRSAHVRGIVAVEASFAHPAGPAIDATGARLDGDLALERSRVDGGVALVHARLEGRLSCAGATVTGPVDAVGSALAQGITLERAHVKGEIGLDGARIGRDCTLRGAQVEGTVRLGGAHVEGDVDTSEARIVGETAIRADGVRVGGGWTMERAQIRGAVRFPAANIGNQVRFTGTVMQVERGAALFGSAATVARGVVLDGVSAVGAVVFEQAQIHGALDLRGSSLVSARLARGGPDPHEHDDDVLSLVDSRLDRLQMPARAEHRPRGVVNLARASTHSLDDHADAWPPYGKGVDDRFDHIILDGFTYEHLQNPGGTGRPGRVWERRLAWLEGQDDRDLDDLFKPAPWVQLARRLRAQGYHEDARRISIARQRRQRRSRAVRWSARLQSSLLDWFALYGHSPWRTVAWIVVFVGLFAGVWKGAAAQCGRADCGDEAVFVRVQRGEFADEPAVLDATYPEFDAVAYSLDLFVPVGDFGHSEYWRPNTRFRPLFAIEQRTVTIGGILYALTVAETVLGLVLTSLAVTGFTGLIARDD